MKNLNLENLKVGDEVVSIFVDKSRNRDGRKYGRVAKILGWSAERNKWQASGMLYIPLDGKGYYAMHSKETPHFYFSANPVHIKAAKKEQSRLDAKIQKQEKLLRAKKELLAPILSDYQDSEESYGFDYLSEDALERLTIRQIKTLVGWLK